MAWVRIDDSYGRNPKILSAGPLCRDLYILALCWCNNQLSDGYIPSSIICTLSPGLRAAGRVAARLVELGLWEQVDGGYQVHDYAEYQPTRAQVMAQREAGAARQRRSQLRRQSHVTDTSVTRQSHVSHTVTDSDPSRPVPIVPSVGSLVTSEPDTSQLAYHRNRRHVIERATRSNGQRIWRCWGPDGKSSGICAEGVLEPGDTVV